MKKSLVIALILLFTTICTLPVAAVTLSSATKQKTEISNKLTELKKQKQKIEADRKQLEKDKANITAQQNNESAEYNELVNEINAIEITIREIDLAIEEAENEYNMQQELLKSRLKVMYQNSNDSLLDMVVNSESLTVLMEKLQYMYLISKNDKKLLTEIEIAKQDVEFKKEMKLDEKGELVSRADEKRERINNLLASRAEIDAKIKQSKQDLAKLEKQEDALIAESNAVQKLINDLSKKNTVYTGGTMKWPLPSSQTVSSFFGMRKHPILKKNKMHTGIDISGRKGDSIVAANNGTVIVSKYNSGGYGYYLIIDHGGGISTLYAHCSKILVKVGDKVKAGQTIAKVGSTGLSTGPHLHFEVRVDGVVKDPLKGYLTKK